MIIATLAMIQVGMAQQPYGGCWHPDYIKTWTSDADENAKFNRSTVPLQERFYDDGIKANPSQYYEGKVAACLTMNPMCSMTPSQGADNFIGYNPNYWQYLDILVWWGGSAGEGIIVPPSAPVTDIAHLNGVKILGCVFFPETAHGGNPAWATQMLTREGNDYPYARKLYEIAKFYGFDGWFINAEGGAQSHNWTEFCRAYMRYATEGGNPGMEIQLYNQSTSASSVMEALKIAGISFMANYGSVSQASYNAQSMLNAGIPQSDIFRKLYSGIECAQGGLYGNGGAISTLFPTSGHIGSIQLFNPEEPIWKQVVKNLLGTPQASGDAARNAMKTVFSKSQGFWVNSKGDPTDATRSGSIWSGLSTAIQERSAITKLPFVSSFGMGLGRYRFVEGEKRGDTEWYHRGMQDILPTWRWWVQPQNSGSKADLKYELSWEDSYNSGAALSITGKLTAGARYLTRLYKTKLTLAGNEEVTLVYKTSTDAAPTIKLATTEDNSTFREFTLVNKTTKNGWTIATADISSLKGKTISIIALEFGSVAQVANFNMQVGQLSIMDKNYHPTPVSVTNLRAQNALKEEISDIRLIWDSPVNENVHHFNVYMERDGQKVLVGQTRNEAFYISKFTRKSSAVTSEKVFVRTVMQDRTEGAEVSLTLNYPTLSLSEVILSASRTLINRGQSVTVTARATKQPQSYQWIVPQGATLTSQTGNTAVFTFANEGRYTIGVKVTNPAGVTTAEVADFIEVKDNVTLTNVARGKSIHSVSGYTNESEHPRNLIDGNEIPNSVSAKWCAGGKLEHWVVIDLQKTYTLYEFKFFDCRHKESFENVENYKIELSNDAKEWREVLHEQDRPQSENTKDAWIKPTVARYVRFTPYDKERPLIIRIWEFQAFGVPFTSGYNLSNLPTQALGLGTPKSLSGTYSLGTDTRKENFAITVTPENTNIATISNLKTTNDTYSFDITPLKVGQTTVTVDLANGDLHESYEFIVNVDDPNRINVLRGRTPVVTLGEYTQYEDASFVPGLPEEKNPATISDGQLETIYPFPFHTNKDITHQLVYDLGKTYALEGFKIEMMDHKYLTHLANLQVWVSTTTNEDSAFTQVYNAPSSPTIPKAGTEIEFPAPIQAKYIKFQLSHRKFYAVVIRELSAYGKLANVPTTHKVTTVTSPEGEIQITGANNLNAVPDGTKIYVAAIAKKGYIVRNLYVNDVPVYEEPRWDNELIHEMNVTSDVVLRAEYAKEPIDVFINDEMTNGHIILHGLSISEHEGAMGDVVTVEVVPDKDYVLNELYYINYDLEKFDITETKSFTLTESVEIYATFKHIGAVESLEAAGIQLYPNPASHYLILSTPNATVFRLYSLKGELVLQTEILEPGQTRINLPALAPGTYLAKVGTSTGKVVIR